MTTKHRLFWTPPLERYDPALAEILNALSDPHATPSDAAVRMASHMEHCELVAEQRGIQLVRCPIPATNMLTALESLGGINTANIQRCLSTWASHFPDR